MSRDHLCVKHGGSRYIDNCVKCNPERCLTHNQDLPCKICKEGNMPPFSAESMEEVFREVEAEKKRLYDRIDNLEASYKTLNLAFHSAMNEVQTKIADLHAQNDALQQQVKMLGSL